MRPNASPDRRLRDFDLAVPARSSASSHVISRCPPGPRTHEQPSSERLHAAPRRAASPPRLPCCRHLRRRLLRRTPGRRPGGRAAVAPLLDHDAPVGGGHRGVPPGAGPGVGVRCGAGRCHDARAGSATTRCECDLLLTSGARGSHCRRSRARAGRRGRVHRVASGCGCGRPLDRGASLRRPQPRGRPGVPFRRDHGRHPDAALAHAGAPRHQPHLGHDVQGEREDGPADRLRARSGIRARGERPARRRSAAGLGAADPRRHRRARMGGRVRP